MRFGHLLWAEIKKGLDMPFWYYFDVPWRRRVIIVPCKESIVLHHDNVLGCAVVETEKTALD